MAAHLSTYKNTLGTTQGGQVVVANGGALVAANSFDLGVGGLVVDPISIVEIGLLGGARKGAVTIDPGTTFSLGDFTYV